jgi:amino acid adenylation domain-containing protein
VSGPPLSFAQQRLWFLDQLLPGDTAYTFSPALRLRGPLDVAALRGALAGVVARHGALRTAFPAEQGEPFQRVLDAVPPPLPVRDASGRDPEARAHALAAELLERPFDLAAGPPLRAELLRLGPEDHVLALAIHHIAFDTWSLGVLYDELSALYAAGTAGPTPPQYVEFSAWQRERLDGPRLAGELAHWCARLAGAPMLLDLPVDRPRPAIQDFAGATHLFALPADVREAAAELRRARGITPFMSLLAGYAALLSRLTGSAGMILGTGVAGRGEARFERSIGFFANTLALRLDLGGDPAFGELLERVRHTALEAFDHQDVPFEKLVDELQPERAMSHNPLFQAMFTLQNARLRLPELPGLAVERFRVRHDSAFVDLWLEAVPRGPETGMALSYKSGLFDAATIERMAAQLVRVLAAGLAEPGTRLSRLPVLSVAERRTVLTGWSRGGPAHPARPAVPELIARRAAAAPDAVAIAFRDREVTYGELAARAGRLAAHLARLGAGPDAVVGVCLPRSDELVAAILGVLWAGAAYLPLDPADPPARRQAMLRTAGARAVVTEDVLATAAAGSPVPLRPAGPDQLAYVIYTSGSTGEPKGVAVPHRGLANRLRWMQDAFGLTPADRVLQKTPATFDVSVWELLWPLMEGAQLVVAEPDGHRDPGYLVDLVERRSVTTMHFVPPMLEAFLERPDLHRCRSLRRVVCSGQALPLELHDRCLERLGAELHNLYGPTEASIDVTWWACERRSGARAVPIGRPIAGAETYVVDGALEPVPQGTPGELLLGGVPLARGYLGRPDLTAERFVPHPFAAELGARLYRTGDLVRWRPDGVIDYLGRTDDQLKVRGYRIEPGEVESALRGHPAVREAVVRSRQDEAGASLVAWVVPDAGSAEVRAIHERAAAETTGAWASVFDEVYREEAGDRGPLDNFAGWSSSYTGLPIPDEEMREWVAATVGRVRRHRPRTILEIGCGLGALLFRLAPEVERYCATDQAPFALDHVRRHLGELAGRVDLHLRAADDLAGLEGPFDLVLLNSVVQYFPGPGYLRRVLERALELAAPGGVVLAGDVRHRGLLEAFHAAVAAERAAASAPAASLAAQARRAAAEENELAVDPDFFRTLPVAAVEVLLRRGRHHNELTRFRYDCVLHVRHPAQPPGSRRLDWTAERLTVDALAGLLDRAAGPVELAGIPNARVASALRAAERLRSRELPETAGQLRDLLRAGPPGVDPEAVARAARARGFGAALAWSADPGRFDALLVPGGGEPAWPRPPLAGADPDALTNHPLRSRVERELAPDLRRRLVTRLPEFMVPARFVVVDRLPLTTSGKVDAAALPAPSAERPDVESPFVAPRDRTEELLAAAWAEVLGLERVGVEDHFFQLGGDSLRSIQVVARAREAGLAITPAQVFQHPTVAALAALAGPAQPPPGPRRALPLSPVQRSLLAESGGDRRRLAALAVVAAGALDGPALERAAARLADRHPALALRLDADGPAWTQGPREIAVDVADLSARSDLHAALRELGERTVARLEGAALRLALAECGTGPGRGRRLLLATSRLLLDEASVEVLRSELVEPVRPAAPDRRFLDWLAAVHPAPDGPAAGPAPGEPERADVTIPRPELEALAAACRMTADELLVATLALALDPPDAEVEIERSARERGQATAGQFAVRTRVVVAAGPAADLRTALAGLKERIRTPVAGRAAPAARFRTTGGDAPPADLLDVLADGDRVTVSGPPERAPAEVAGRLARWAAELAALAGEEEPGLVTPSDFPLAGLGQEALRGLLGAGGDVEDVYPLGPLQEWMLWQHRFAPRPGLYVGHSVFELDAAGVEPGALEAAWQAMVDRYATLRTGFAWRGLARPLQVVRRSARVPFAREDWRGLQAAEREARLDELVVRERLRGFDLDVPPHLRMTLVRWDEASYRFVLILNYMVLDGWSYPLVLHEAIAAHDAIRRGGEPAPSDRPAFRDYVAWTLAQDPAPGEAYWAGALRGMGRSPLVLGSDVAPPAGPERHLAVSHHAALPVALTTALASQARRHELTLYTLLQAAWALLLRAHTGSNDVVCGNVLSGRPAGLPGAERIVGYCTLHVPARIRVAPGERLVPWLRELQAEQLVAREHGFCSLPRIREAAGLPRNRDLYDTCLIYLDLLPDPAGPRPRGWRRLDSMTNTEHVLRLVAQPARSLQLGLAHCPRDLDAGQVTPLLGELQALLAAMAHSLDRTVGELEASGRAAVLR